MLNGVTAVYLDDQNRKDQEKRQKALFKVLPKKEFYESVLNLDG